MAYKHLIQKDSPYVLYPMDAAAVAGQYQPFGGTETNSASIVSSADVFSTANTLSYYTQPIVLGNSISSYIDSNKKIKIAGRGFFTEKNKKRSYSIEFWMRHYGNNYNTETRIVSASGSNYSGLWIDGQYLVYKYGDSTSSAIIEASVPVEKYDVPLHVIMTFNPSNISLSVNNIQIIKQFDDTDVYLSPYDAAKDFLFFGSVNNLEICNIAIYGYDILQNDIISKNHFLYGQGYEVEKTQYEIRGGLSNSMNLQQSSPKVVIDAKQIFNGTRYDSTWKKYPELLQYGTTITNEGLTIKGYSFNELFSVSTLQRSANTASGTSIEKGSYILFEDLRKNMNDYEESFAIETSLYHAMPPTAGASSTLLFMQSDSDQSNVWIYMVRQTAASSTIGYSLYNRNGGLLTSSTIYPGAYIANGKEFKIGAARRKNPTTLNKEFVIYAKYNSTTASVTFDIDSDTYNFLQNVAMTRIGSKDVYDDSVALSDISNDYSWTSPSLLYVNSMILGEPTDILTGSYSKYYKKYQFDYSKNRFKLGAFNASAILPISFYDIGVESASAYTIYPNRLEFSFPNQEQDSNAASAVQIFKYIYTGSVLTSSARIYKSTDIFIQPKIYSDKTEVSSSAAHIVIKFNEDDIEYKKPTLNSIQAYFMNNNYLYASQDMPPIELVYGANASVSIPAYQKTAFINNSVSDGGLLIGSSSYYGIINVASVSFQSGSIGTISFFVKSASLNNSTILQVNASTIFSHILTGASAFVNNSVASMVYKNGASVSITTGSISTVATNWNRYDIVLSTPISTPASIVIGASGMVTNNKFFIDEFAIFSKKFKDRDAANIYNLFQFGYTSSVSVKDGVSPTINMLNTYGATASSKVMIAMFDKETSASTTRFADKIQLTTKELLENVRALKIMDSATTTSPEILTSNISEQYVDGIKLAHNDKVLTITGTGSFVYTASYNQANTQIRFTGASAVTASSLYFIQEGRMFSKRYLSMDKFSGTLKPNIEVDKAKIKYIKRKTS